ncbi:MAG: zinc-ribbon domain-containing protein, partial [Gammaproteobacteria bacterium]|nr:zinc-ribbon domain-containing protein [Gammaproteobacteria bacterium]
MYFDNTQCLQCGKSLGFDTSHLEVIPLLEIQEDNWHSDSNPDLKFRKCNNSQNANRCNWLIPANENESFCMACRLNVVIPDLSKPENEQRWRKLENAKRRLIYTLLTLRLPIINYHQDADHGLGFRF